MLTAIMHINQTVITFCTILLIPCAQATTTVDASFPYGAAPQGNVCVTSDNYATPETLLGSWAMQQAVESDVTSQVLPAMFTKDNLVYAVGTAAIGDQLGVPDCSGGCNQINGFCFALKFNDKLNYPYMIFQSVNIGANANSFDIYLPGGGSGAFPAQCAQFWGTGDSVNWADHIQNATSCETYFNQYNTINSSYVVKYAGETHTAKDTLKNACTFSSSAKSGFNTQNFAHVTVVPVTCPTSLTQTTGLQLSSSTTKLGNQTIHNLSELTAEDFQTSSIKDVTTTQMQDCKTPSSGYCGNTSNTVTNYEASISASLIAPILSGTNYCTQNPSFSGGFCSWDQGKSSGSAYCNESKSQCISCGNAANWCTCDNGSLQGCEASSLRRIKRNN